ncbi:MAG: DUF4215 domain-containing protein [Candidatus Peribacteria bacterium]|nr:MAG: DUF4215 domain-containing protein [Candidatus Peribacteria bacterium]
MTIIAPNYLIGQQYRRMAASDLLGNTSISPLLDFDYNTDGPDGGFPYCGNGKRDVGEECDDGNNNNDDACDNDCNNNYGECGDNALNNPDEECDDGNLVNGDGCSNLCKTEVPPPIVCGDGAQQGEEACDDGNLTNGDGCSDTCTRETSPVCGDSNITPDEICGEDGLPVCPNGEACQACLCEPITLE